MLPSFSSSALTQSDPTMPGRPKKDPLSQRRSQGGKRKTASSKRSQEDDDPPVPQKRAGAKRTGEKDDPPAPPEPTTRQPPATPPTHSHGTRAATAARSPHVSSPPSSPKAAGQSPRATRATQAAKSPSRAQAPVVGQVRDISGDDEDSDDSGKGIEMRIASSPDTSTWDPTVPTESSMHMPY